MPDGQDETRTQTLLLVTGAGALILGFLALQSARRVPVPCPVSTGILARSNDAIYAIVSDQNGGCVKRHVVSSAVFAACGYKMAWVFELDAAVLNSIPDGPPIDGTDCPPIPTHAGEPPPPAPPPPPPPPPPPCPLQTGILAAAADPVYAIVAGKSGGCVKRHIISRAVFLNCGYKWAWIFPVQQSVLDKIPNGSPITGTDCPPIPIHHGEPAPPPPPSITYTIVSGDNLWNIAKRFCGNGMYWWWIWRNNLGVLGANPNLIYPGQTITIPQPCPSPVPLPTPGPVICGTTYTVIAGDTLWSIAQRAYGDGSQWGRIYNANKAVIGGDPNLIFPGQKLYIPC